MVIRMITFIILFFPAVISLLIFERINKATLSKRTLIYLFSTNVLIINLACFTVKLFFSRGANKPFDELLNNMTPFDAFIYILISLVVAVLAALVESFIRKNVEVSIEVKDEKKQ